MGTFEYYLIGINIAGFFLYLINMWLYSNTAEGRIDKVLTITSLLGGALGSLLAIVLFDRKPVKENMMSRVFVICILVIQIIILLMVKGHHADEITWKFWEFFRQYKILLYYLGIINFVTFAVFAIDKVNAAEHRTRIRIVTLLGLAFIGGSIADPLHFIIFRTVLAECAV